ncbi:hypothetical protein GCM10009425_31440 [Pseudomonas asuensis]|jgi:hypothetical protein|uniref:Uncharacterized protein n=1 Tax=Pseudomonas asuensis TaxID=1825787 RepID=A0ABQ2GX76_9PSED|nr:hypothetical protein [Pseudomonas asuensis]GGM18185.1 hypothetical protein GCM10009425_31440 [Pseudomonas asuensis]
MIIVKVNKEQWDAIGSDEQQRIEKGLRECGALEASVVVAVDDSEAPFDTALNHDPDGSPIKDVRETLRDSTAVTGMDWCHANTEGAAQVACLSIVSSSMECKNRGH